MRQSRTRTRTRMRTIKNKIMKSGLRADLKQLGKMAFVRAADCTEVIKRFHRLKPKVQSLKSEKGKTGDKRQGADFELLKEVYEWVFVPMSIWPVDVRGLCLHLLDCVESGRRVDERARLL